MKAATAGIDSWSVCWHTDPGGEVGGLIESANSFRAARGIWLQDKVGGYRIGWYGDPGMVVAEGRPGGDEGLWPADNFGGALGELEAAMEAVGLRPWADPRQKVPPGKGDSVIGGKAMLRRLDTTVDMHFDHSYEGLGVLKAIAAQSVGGMKMRVMTETSGRAIETVELRGWSGKNVLGRWYDKGVESGRAARGTLIRPEDQRRFRSGTRPAVEEVAESGAKFARSAFVRRFEPLWKASRGVKVGGIHELAIRASELMEDGALTPGEAKAVLGHLVLETASAHRQSERQVRRDRGLARKHGLVLADDPADEFELDLEEVLEAALDASTWGAQG